MDGINGTPKIVGRNYKRGIKPSTRFKEKQLIRAKRALKRLIKPWKIEKKGKHCEGS